MINGRFSLIPAVYIVFRRNDDVLLLRRFQTDYHDGDYSLPAGHVDGGEPALRAAVREAKEETGLTLRPENLKLVHTMHRYSEHPKSHERLDLFFEVIRWDGEPANTEPQKCDELRWVGLQNLPVNMVPEVRQALQKIGANEPYSDYNF